jgi:hypothetical protein
LLSSLKARESGSFNLSSCQAVADPGVPADRIIKRSSAAFLPIASSKLVILERSEGPAFLNAYTNDPSDPKT